MEFNEKGELQSIEKNEVLVIQESYPDRFNHSSFSMAWYDDYLPLQGTGKAIRWQQFHADMFEYIRKQKNKGFDVEVKEMI